ncbi:MAG: phytanoyl-CoA dioxygenase family protein [Pseudomonadales bacterium]|jgi:ectoine hydroxylase-related dioxygenase (phytanoyl-CoA dioxygenase family)
MEHYQNDGFGLVDGLIDLPTIQALDAERRRFSNPDAALAVDLQLVHRSRVLRDFVVNGPQVALAVQVLGPNVCFTHQQFVSKAARADPRTDVPWHQDSGYGRLEPPTDLTVWIAMTETNPTNGCLWVLPGSHREGLKPHGRSGPLMAAQVEAEGIPVPMQAGDALLFSGHLLHRSLPNRSAAARHALYLRYCTPDVVMVSNGDRPVLEDGFSWMVAGEAD